MKFKMCVTHVQSGSTWVGEESDVTLREFDKDIATIKDNLKEITVMQLGNVILPGDFIRNHCVIEFIESV